MAKFDEDFAGSEVMSKCLIKIISTVAWDIFLIWVFGRVR